MWMKDEREKRNPGRSYDEYGTLAYGKDRFRRMQNMTFAVGHRKHS